MLSKFYILKIASVLTFAFCLGASVFVQSIWMNVAPTLASVNGQHSSLVTQVVNLLIFIVIFSFGFRAKIIRAISWPKYVAKYLNPFGVLAAAIVLSLPSALVLFFSEAVVKPINWPGSLIFFVTLNCLVNVITEEIYYRFVVMKAVSWVVGPIAGNVVQAFIFAVMHFQALKFDYLHLMYFTFFGLLLGYVYLMSQSLIPGILLHFVFNIIDIVKFGANYGQLQIFGLGAYPVSFTRELLIVNSTLIVLIALSLRHAANLRKSGSGSLKENLD